MQVVEFR